MGCYKGLTSVCTILVFLFTLILTPSRLVLSDEIPKCQDGNNTAKSCCPCFQESMDNCTAACPQDYLLINVSKGINCEKSSSSVANETATNITTTTEAMATENSTVSPYSENGISVLYCIKSCDIGEWYNNDTLQCDDCDEKCRKCDNKENCTVCKYVYEPEQNKTLCVAECPEGTEESDSQTKDGAKLCKKSEREAEKLNLITIIAPSVGGGVGLVIIGIIIFCCCRRRRRNEANIGDGKRKAMSMLLEQKPENRNEGVASKKQAGRPAGYENMSQTLPTGTQIQNQGDNVLRYTKDPTVKINSQENEENTDEEENYGNVAMIKLAKKTDLTNKGQEDMNEMLDIQELGVAPKAPLPLPSSKGKKKGKGIVKSFSQRVSKKFGRMKEKSSAAKPEEHIPEDYVDMSGEQKQSAEKAGTSKAENRDSSELEDYENVDYNGIPVGRKAAVSKVKETSPEEGMEIYENAPGPTSKKTDGNNSDMEDYENTKELKLDKSKKPKGKGKAKPKADENEMEDYENMQDLELYENVCVSRKK